MLRDSTLQSFEEVYKQAYSHGLENIYALENVDLKSIRRLENKSISISLPHTQKSKNPVSKLSKQLKFNFGLGFNEGITPFILHEPIQTLELSKYTEKALLEFGKKKISDLLNLNSFALIKKIGQGNLDEVKEKLHSYGTITTTDLEAFIDLNSFLRCIFLDGPRKKNFVFLKKYGLDELLTLLPSENMELKRLTPNLSEEWIQEAIIELQSDDKIAFVNQKINEITLELIHPWMRQRLNLASEDEIIERIEFLSINSNLLDQALKCLGELYFNKQFPLSNNLHQCAQGVFSTDLQTKQDFHAIIDKTKSYFYKPKITYRLDELITWLKREFAKKWIGFPEGMIKKVLLLSPEFNIWKGHSGQIEIKNLLP